MRVLKSIETLDVSEFPVTMTETTIGQTRRLNETERLALAKITKADSPFLPPVVRDDEPGAQEFPSSKIVVLCGHSLNAGDQEGAVEMIKAVKLVNAATYSILDLSRAQRTDLVTVALRKRRAEGPLKGTPHKTKPQEDPQDQLDAQNSD